MVSTEGAIWGENNNLWNTSLADWSNRSNQGTGINISIPKSGARFWLDNQNNKALDWLQKPSRERIAMTSIL